MLRRGLWVLSHKSLNTAERYGTSRNKERSNSLPQADAERLNTYFPREDWNLYFWGFTCFSRQDYARTVPLDGVDEIMLGVECIEGGCLGEMAVRWFMLGNEPVPRLDVFDEAWPLLQTPTFAAVLVR